MSSRVAKKTVKTLSSCSFKKDFCDNMYNAISMLTSPCPVVGALCLFVIITETVNKFCRELLLLKKYIKELFMKHCAGAFCFSKRLRRCVATKNNFWFNFYCWAFLTVALLRSGTTQKSFQLVGQLEKSSPDVSSGHRPDGLHLTHKHTHTRMQTNSHKFLCTQPIFSLCFPMSGSGFTFYVQFELRWNPHE